MNYFSISAKLAACLIIFFIAGCASTVPKANFIEPLEEEERLTADDRVRAIVLSDPGLDMLEVERERIAQRTEERIFARNGDLLTGEPRDLEIEINITRYDKGNAFARAMLAGLGSMHLHGTVRLIELPERVEVSVFEMQKTFAWGGIYGASTSMEDIEYTFCEAIAATVTGTKEVKKNGD